MLDRHMKYSIHPYHADHAGLYPKLNTDDVKYLIKLGLIACADNLLTESDRILDDFMHIGYILDKSYEVIIMEYDGGEEMHFHIVDTETMGDKFDAAVKINTPEYYIHSNNDAGSKLTKEMCMSLNSMLSDNAEESDISTWEHLKTTLWFKNNKRSGWKRLRKNKKQPDYTKLQKA